SANYGGGIYAYPGSLDLNNVTISNNNASAYGGGIYISSGLVSIKNSILSGNTSGVTAVDCLGGVISLGNNLIGNTSGCIIAPTSGDEVNVNPMLGTFLSMQGYQPLLSGSPAIDAGNPATCLANDQRGIARIGTCDIGAYEYTLPGSAVSL